MALLYGGDRCAYFGRDVRWRAYVHVELDAFVFGVCVGVCEQGVVELFAARVVDAEGQVQRGARIGWCIPVAEYGCVQQVRIAVVGRLHHGGLSA